MSHTLGQHSAALFWRRNAGRDEGGPTRPLLSINWSDRLSPAHHNRLLLFDWRRIIGNIGRLFSDRQTSALHVAPIQKSIGEFVDFSKIIWVDPPFVSRWIWINYYISRFYKITFGPVMMGSRELSAPFRRFLELDGRTLSQIESDSKDIR